MKPRIMVLSSDAIYRRAVGLALAHLQEELQFVSSIEEAFELTQWSPPTLLITDCTVSHPGDGIECAVELRERLPRLRCIVTGDTDPTRSCSAVRDLHWLQFFQRPFSMVRFVTGVIRALEQPFTATGENGIGPDAKLNLISFPKQRLVSPPVVVRPVVAN